MLTIIDVDYLDNFKLTLTFNNGFDAMVDLEKIYHEHLAQFAESFVNFSLTDGALCWNNEKLNANDLWEISTGKQMTKKVYLDSNNPLELLTKAFSESLEENNPTILQAALRGYAEKIGFLLDKEANIKSRNIAYKSLSQTSSSQWETIVKLAHSIISD